MSQIGTAVAAGARYGNTIRCQIAPPIAEIVLNRPERGNSFTPELLTELADVTTRLAADREVRAVVVKGAGKDFCYGGSVDMFLDESADRRPAMVRELVTLFHVAITRLTRLEVPVLGIAHGSVAGGGISLLAACDVVVAAASTRFRMGWSGIGLSMDGGSTWLLPRIIGVHRTLALLYTNRVFTAAEAEAWGLVNCVVDDNELHSFTSDLAVQLSSGPTSALAACKRLILDGGSQAFERSLQEEADAVVRASGSAEADEGFRAFRERRAPQFTGK